MVIGTFTAKRVKYFIDEYEYLPKRVGYYAYRILSSFHLI